MINTQASKHAIQEGYAVFNRHVEDIRVQKLKNDDPHLFIASAAVSSHQMEPVFTFQFFFRDSLDHVRKLLCDEAFEFAEGLLLKNRAYLFFFVGRALTENQFSNLVKQGRGWVPQVSLQLFHALEVSQLRKLIARKLQKLRHFPINICSARRWRQFLPSQQLGNVGLRDFGGSG